MELAKQALIIEEHYGTPMDIEWGKDGRPARSTSCRRGPRRCRAAPAAPSSGSRLKSRSTLLVSGRSIGQRIGAGHARVIRDVKEMSRVRAGDVLVADMTDPDWEPVMKRAVRHRHQPRRPYLPCGHHRARARHSRRGRLRDRHPGDSREPGGDGILRRGRHGPRLRRHARIRPAQHRARLAAAHPREDLHEHRQSGPRVRVRRPAEQRASASRGSNSSSTA